MVKADLVNAYLKMLYEVNISIFITLNNYYHLVKKVRKTRQVFHFQKCCNWKVIYFTHEKILN